MLAAGDIARCDILGGAVATARLLDRLPGTILTLGDNAYESGAPAEFEKCYAPTWGRHLDRTRPAPGNHDYRTRNAAGYFGYFGDRAGPPGLGYYSFDLGTWHIISLNSAIAVDPRSPQGKWLAKDLAAHPTECTLAYFHVPVYSSGPHGSRTEAEDNRAERGVLDMHDLWRPLAEAGTDVVLSGHDHDYERFAPLDAKGRSDAVNGTRQFVVGTGGGGVYRFKTIAPHSEVRDNSAVRRAETGSPPGTLRVDVRGGGGAILYRCRNRHLQPGPPAALIGQQGQRCPRALSFTLDSELIVLSTVPGSGFRFLGSRLASRFRGSFPVPCSRVPVPSAGS